MSDKPAPNKSILIFISNSLNNVFRKQCIYIIFMSDFGLSCAWRSRNATLREYTSFSLVYHSYSHISSSLMASVSDSQIHPITISDHAPVSLSVIKTNITEPTRNWRFNTSQLKESDFLKYFEGECTIFLETNNQLRISPGVLWETAKAVIRGKIIF